MTIDNRLVTLPAPGNKNAFMVASDSTSRPHFVQQKAGGKVICDDNCPMWRGRKVCSHTIVVAESLSGLKQFVQALQKSKLECNLTSLVTTPTDRRKAGTKSGAPRKRGRSTTTTTYRNRLDDVCTTLDEIPAPRKCGPSKTPTTAYCSDDVCTTPTAYCSDDVCTTPDEVLAPEKCGPSSTPIAAYRSPGDDVPSRPVTYGDSSIHANFSKDFNMSNNFYTPPPPQFILLRHHHGMANLVITICMGPLFHHILGCTHHRAVDQKYPKATLFSLNF